MKKTITLLSALLITMASFACHFIGQGRCGDSVYFKTTKLYNGATFECRSLCDTTTILYSYTAADSGSTDKTFSFYAPIEQQTGIEWHYFYNGSWTDWLTEVSIDSNLCTVTPVQLSNLTASLKNDLLTVSFVAGAAPVDHYNIQVTADSVVTDKTVWQTVDTVNHAGTFTLNLAGEAMAGLGLLGLGFIGFKKKRLIWLAMSLLCCIFYVSCSKEAGPKPDKKVSYKYMRVQEVYIDGGSQISNIKVL